MFPRPGELEPRHQIIKLHRVDAKHKAHELEQGDEHHHTVPPRSLLQGGLQTAEHLTQRGFFTIAPQGFVQAFLDYKNSVEYSQYPKHTGRYKYKNVIGNMAADLNSDHVAEAENPGED